jgi:hypothetical protein
MHIHYAYCKAHNDRKFYFIVVVFKSFFKRLDFF